MIVDKKQENIWWLGSAGKYRDRPGQGSFSPRELVSTHKFGWNREKKCFCIEDFGGWGVGTSRRELAMPIELAEAFLLLLCADKVFVEIYLKEFYPEHDAERIVECGEHKLKLHRSKYRRYRSGDALPSFSMSLVGDEERFNGFTLFYQLRSSFAAHIDKLSPEEVRKNLRAT